ncbi:imm11 family protein [Corallococcus terminator]
MNFYHLDTLGDGDEEMAVFDDFVDGIDRYSWRVHEGVPLAPDWPKNAKLLMNKENPGIKLGSLLGNTRSMLLVDKELKELIQAHCQGLEIEYLPLVIYDHHKRVRGRDYFLINPLSSLDCLDLQASEICWDKNDPTNVIAVNKYVLQRDKVAEAPPLFRIQHDPSEYVLRTDLAKAIYDRKPTNMSWEKLPFSS